MTDLTATQFYFDMRDLCHRDVCHHLSVLRKALLEMKIMSRKAILENDLSWQQEVEKVKREKDQEWLDKFNEIKEENGQLRKLLQSLKYPSDDVINDALLLREAECEIDKLNRQLDQKLIHINKLQNALAKHSKTIIELEKSYALHCLRSIRGENLMQEG